MPVSDALVAEIRISAVNEASPVFEEMQAQINELNASMARLDGMGSGAGSGLDASLAGVRESMAATQAELNGLASGFGRPDGSAAAGLNGLGGGLEGLDGKLAETSTQLQATMAEMNGYAAAGNAHGSGQ